MTAPRIIATDLDGTLLRSGSLSTSASSASAISDRTRRALDLARRAGAEIVFITARPPRYVDRLADAVDHTGIAICLNGALLYDLATRTITETRSLGTDLARHVADAIAAALPGVAFGVETGHGVVSEAAFTLRHPGDEHLSLATLDDVWGRAETIAKLLVWSATHGADDLLDLARAAAPAGVEITHSGGPGLLEISAAGVTKAGALAAYCQTRGAGPDDVIAFGDMPNDLAVLTWAGTAYAMANAHPTVLAAIAHHTAANDDDGVAQVLERLYRDNPAVAGQEAVPTSR